MSVLLRSCFIASPKDDDELFQRNVLDLRNEGLGFHVPEDIVIWNEITSFFLDHNHAPKLSTLREHFTRIREAEVVNRLEALSQLQPKTRGDFQRHLKEKVEERRTAQCKTYLKEAAKILSEGLVLNEGDRKKERKLKGAVDSIRYLQEVSHTLIAPRQDQRLSGDLVGDTDEFKNRYERVEADPTNGLGQFSGIYQLDSSMRGLKKKELWTHAAFTGGGKCLAHDTLIWDVSTGERRTVKEIFESQKMPVVHALDEDRWEMTQAPVSAVWESGVRKIHKVVSQAGREIRVSGNHPFRTPSGWVNAEDLNPGDWVAVPGDLAGFQGLPVDVETLLSLPEGIWAASPFLWESSDEVVRSYLTSVLPEGSFSSGSLELVLDVQSLMQRVGVRGQVFRTGKQWEVRVDNSPENFPPEFSGKTESNVKWDRVRSVELDGVEMTYDMEVPGPANFVANGFITHNSSLALQWAYNQAVTYRFSVLYVSLEMPYHQCQNIIHGMHTFHEKFRKVRIELGIQKPSKKSADGSMIHYDKGLDYEKIKNGELNEVEKRFLFEYVEADFNDPDNEYGSIYLEVPDPDKMTFTIADLKMMAEMRYASGPFDMMIVDHMGLMSPMGYKQNTTEALNEVLRSMKQLTMSFNRGAGIGILGLYQISREGYKTAEKNDGKYNLTALSYASEAEKSSDIVTAGWMDDELKAKGRLLIQCLKSRDATPFERFPIRIEWHCRRMLTDFDGVDMAMEESSKDQFAELGEALDAQF